MKKLKPTVLSNILKKHDICHNSIISKASHLLDLNNALQKFLPEPMSKFCGIVNINGVNLTLYARTSAWCYKLRLHASEISNFLIAKGVSIQNVRVVVIPSSPEIGTISLPTPEISDKAQESIRKTAEAMEDSELKKVLLHFVNNLDKNTTESDV